MKLRLLPYYALFFLHLASLEAKEDFLVVEEVSPLRAREFSFVVSKYFTEREYEDGEQVIDQKDNKAWLFEFGKGFALTNELSLEVGLSFEYQGKSQHRFDHSTGLSNREFSYKGIHAVRSRLIYQFQDDAKRSQGILLEVRGLGERGHDTRAKVGGYDFGLSYLSRWHLGNLFTQTHLKAMFFGKKNVQKLEGGREITDPYSVVEFQGTMGMDYRQWIFAFTPGFGLTNDFNIRSDNYSRLSDKGFTLHLRLVLAHEFGTTWVSLSHTRRSHVFNNVTDIPSDEIDFEIESQATALEFLWRL